MRRHGLGRHRRRLRLLRPTARLSHRFLRRERNRHHPAPSPRTDGTAENRPYPRHPFDARCRTKVRKPLRPHVDRGGRAGDVPEFRETPLRLAVRVHAADSRSGRNDRNASPAGPPHRIHHRLHGPHDGNRPARCRAPGLLDRLSGHARRTSGRTAGSVHDFPESDRTGRSLRTRRPSKWATPSQTSGRE